MLEKLYMLVVRNKNPLIPFNKTLPQRESDVKLSKIQNEPLLVKLLTLLEIGNREHSNSGERCTKSVHFSRVFETIDR